jgi:hypothetical protein
MQTRGRLIAREGLARGIWRPWNIQIQLRDLGNGILKLLAAIACASLLLRRLRPLVQHRLLTLERQLNFCLRRLVKHQRVLPGI